MRKHYFINLLFILLFVGTVLSIIMLRNHSWNYANLMGNDRGSVNRAAEIAEYLSLGIWSDSTEVEKVLSFLTSNSSNDKFKNYIKSVSKEDSTVYQHKVIFNDIDGYAVGNSQHKKDKHYLSAYPEDGENKQNVSLRNIANIDYHNKNFKVQLQRFPVYPSSYLLIVIFDITMLFIILILALKRSSPYHTYFKSIFIISFLKILFFFLSLSSDYYSYFCLISQLTDKIIHIVFILAFYKILAKYHPFIPRLFIVVILLNLWFDTIWIPTIIYIVSVFLIIFSERGVKRRIYLQNLFFLLLFIGSFLGAMFSLGMIIYECGVSSFQDLNYSTGFMIPIGGLDFTSYGASYFYLPSFMLIILVMISLIFRIVKIKIFLIEHLYIWVLKLFLVFISILLTIFVWFIDYPPQVLRTVGLSLLIVIFYLLYNKYLKLFPFINPVRFNVRKLVIKLLNDSYTYTNHTEYTEFFYKFLKKIQAKAKISIISEKSVVGDVMPQLRYSRLKEVIELDSKNKSYLNLDIELLDDTEIGKNVEDFNNNDLPHLLYPIYNKQGELQAVIAFGKFPGIYWQKSLAEALFKLVEVFSGFYLNFLVQEKYLEQGKAIVKEQEERLFNQKLWEVESKKNEELETERQHIMKSMEYASLIQKSILPQENEMLNQFPDHFTIWKQRDIVGGDLYWLYPIPDTNQVIFSVIDCTGHGIPGALMSVASNSALEQLVQKNSNYNPGTLLTNLHQSIGNTLHQSSQNTQQDGMDMGIINYDKKSKKLQFAGANHNLILIKGKTQELKRIKGEHNSIGGLKWKSEIEFSCHDIQLESGDTIYLFSDGVIDQPFQHSEDKLRRLGTKAWYDFLVENNQQSMDEVKASIEVLITEMIVSSPQRDDICIVGIRVD